MPWDASVRYIMLMGWRATDLRVQAAVSDLVLPPGGEMNGTERNARVSLISIINEFAFRLTRVDAPVVMHVAKQV